MEAYNINEPSYLESWLRDIEKYPIINPKNIWEEILIKKYNNIDSNLYLLLSNEFKSLKEQSGTQFSLNLTTSITSLAQIIFQIDPVSNKMREITAESNTKDKMFEYLHLYISLSQGAFFDLLVIINSMISLKDKSNYYQKNLTPMIDFLSSSKHNYKIFTNLVDSRIRNSYDHNGVTYSSRGFEFSYRKGKQRLSFFLDHQEIITNLNALIVGLKTAVKLFIDLIQEEKISNSEILSFSTQMLKLSWSKLLLSTRYSTCNQFEITTIINNKQQLTLHFDGIDINNQNRSKFMMDSSTMAYTLATKSGFQFDRIFISYSSPRTLESFVAIPTDKIINYLSDSISSKEFYSNNDGFFWEVNDDSQPTYSIDYKDIVTIDYKIKEITDISNDSEKVFSAVVILASAQNKNEVISNALKIISILKELPNGGNLAFKTKHGNFDADRVYFNIYKDESQSRSLFPDNQNFVTTVQFDNNLVFPINSENPLLSHLKKEVFGNIEYGWNPEF